MIQLRATQLKSDVRAPEVEGRLGVVSGRSRTTAFGQHRTLSEVENERLNIRSQTISSRSAANRRWVAMCYGCLSYSPSTTCWDRARATALPFASLWVPGAWWRTAVFLMYRT